MGKDYYQILGVERSASEAELKKGELLLHTRFCLFDNAARLLKFTVPLNLTVCIMVKLLTQSYCLQHTESLQ